MNLLRFALLLGAALALTGCNTMEGLGKDISRAGDKIEEAAKKTGGSSRRSSAQDPAPASPAR